MNINIEINNPNDINIEIDGQTMTGLTEFNFNAAVGQIPELKMKQYNVETKIIEEKTTMFNEGVFITETDVNETIRDLRNIAGV